MEGNMNRYQAIEDEIPSLRRYALKLTRDRSAIDDLVQECLVRALGAVHRWQEGTNLRAWLFTIMHNLYVSGVRRSVRDSGAVELSEVEPLLAHAPAQDKGLELRDVRRVMATLTRGQRDAVCLIGLEGWTYERVAAASGISVGTIRSRVHRGRKRLKMAA
jgi:RNA polymerase sigma-70 factor, ECF subfamily